VVGIIIAAILILAVLASLFVLWRRGRAAKIDRRQITVPCALAEARGRTIVVGELHADREGLRATLALMSKAHEVGYRKLGVEVSEEGLGKYRGLRDEIAFIGRQLDEELDERDELTYLDAVPGNDKPRFNRHWQIRTALRLGWEIVPVDPRHWDHLSDDECGYITSREPAMAEAILRHGPMIAVCGYGHLAGLDRLLGRECVMYVCSRTDIRDAGRKKFWSERIRFAATLPRLIA
jgi:hypothetical protein